MEINEPTLVTVGLTVFNSESTVKSAVGSALGQNRRPVEVLIVDDASTDASWAIISALAGVHPEIRAFRHAANMGVGAAKNVLAALEQPAEAANA